jgi:tol-pal system protein YbgF
MFKKFGTGLVGLVLFVAMIVPSLAGTKEDLMRLQSDVLSLQKQILELQRTSDDNAKDIKNLLQMVHEQLAKSNATLTSIRDTMADQQTGTKRAVDEALRSLGEKLDETNNKISLLADEVKSLKIKVTEPRPGSLGGSDSVPPPSELWQTAYRDFLQGNYDLALQELQTYVTRYPDAERADEAQYYIGEALLQQNKATEAIQAFDQVINRFPRSKMIPAAYLRKGDAFLKLNQRTEAIDQFRYLTQNFPEAPEAKTAQQKLASLGVSSRPPRKTSQPPGKKRTG